MGVQPHPPRMSLLPALLISAIILGLGQGRNPPFPDLTVMKKIFSVCNTDGVDGQTYEEIIACTVEHPEFNLPEPNEERFKKVDLNNDDIVTFEEFQTVMKKKFGRTPPFPDLTVMEKIFSVCNTDGVEGQTYEEIIACRAPRVQPSGAK